MEVIFLGTGTSQGVPIIAHENPGLDLADLRNWRTRSSIHVIMGGHHVQIDAGPEFRLQALREGLTRIDTFILTHGHADHILGMDDLRRFCDVLGGTALPVYSSPEGLERINAIYPYAISDKPKSLGYPAFQVDLMPPKLEVPGGTIWSCSLPHGRIETLGLVFEEAGTGAKFGYFCDCKDVTARGFELARGAQAVALDGLRPEPHPSHMNVEEAIAAAAEIGAPEAYLTHLTRYLDHATWEPRLPKGVHLAYDGLRLNLPR